MANGLNLSTTHKERNILLYEAPTSSSNVINMVASDGSLIVFNDGGNWIDNAGDQMIDNLADELIFGMTQWGSNFTITYLLGPRKIASDDLSYNIIRS